MLEEKIILSFVFETFDLAKGEVIKEIRADMQRYAMYKWFCIVPDSKHVGKDFPVYYYDILAFVKEGEKYMSAFNWGKISNAKDDMVRLKSFFETKDTSLWEKQIFQNIFNETYDYVIDKGFYIGWFDERIVKPPIVFHDSDFFMSGPTGCGFIEVNYGKKIVDYVESKRREYRMPEPPSKCATCLANCTNKEEQTLKNLLEK